MLCERIEKNRIITKVQSFKVDLVNAQSTLFVMNRVYLPILVEELTNNQIGVYHLGSACVESPAWDAGATVTM